MDFSKLEAIEKFTEIVAAIERGASHGGDLWQMDLTGERMIFQITELKVDILHNQLSFKTNSHLFVNAKLPFFIRLRYRNMIFRVSPEDCEVDEDQLICKIPHEARALASRTTDRYVLPVDSDISLSLKRFSRNVRDNGPLLEVRMIDVSESGIGILLSGGNRNFLQTYDHFWIKAINHQRLSYDILGTVLYVAPKSLRVKRSDVRLGLSLASPLSWEVYQGLKRQCRLVLSA